MFTYKKTNDVYQIVNSDSVIVYETPSWVYAKSKESDILNLVSQLNKKGYRDLNTIENWEKTVRPTKLK